MATPGDVAGEDPVGAESIGCTGGLKAQLSVSLGVSCTCEVAVGSVKMAAPSFHMQVPAHYLSAYVDIRRLKKQLEEVVHNAQRQRATVRVS